MYNVGKWKRQLTLEATRDVGSSGSKLPQQLREILDLQFTWWRGMYNESVPCVSYPIVVWEAQSSLACRWSGPSSIWPWTCPGCSSTTSHTPYSHFQCLSVRPCRQDRGLLHYMIELWVWWNNTFRSWWKCTETLDAMVSAMKRVFLYDISRENAKIVG